MPTDKPTPSPTLAQALEHAYRTRWAHARDGGKCLYSQAKLALGDVADHLGLPMSDPRWAMDPMDRHTIAEVDEHKVRKATQHWYKLGLSPATITKRLNCLSVMGVNVQGHRPKKSRKLQWWLRPEEEERACALLDANAVPGIEADLAFALAAHIRWTTKTGLRVEETLRLTHHDFGKLSVTVPGTKTANSQATLPLSQATRDRGQETLVVLLGYQDLEAAWRKLRAHMGWPQGATLKALRRSAARYLHVECLMPLDMVRDYLRHDNIETTVSYLRLVGGYKAEDMRRFLK